MRARIMALFACREPRSRGCLLDRLLDFGIVTPGRVEGQVRLGDLMYHLGYTSDASFLPSEESKTGQ
jgi:hypothetical protein